MNEYYWNALERAIAEIIAQFREAPDLWQRQADLHAALYRALRGYDLLAERILTRDGRAVQLLHLAEPARFAYPPGEPEEAPETPAAEAGRLWLQSPPSRAENAPSRVPSADEGRLRNHSLPALAAGGSGGASSAGGSSGASVAYDLAILNPAFVRAHRLAAITGADGGALDALRRLPPAERPTPLLAALNARLVDDLAPQTLRALEAPLYDLARAEPDAFRTYYLILCRHWDLDAHARRAVETLAQWQVAAPNVNLALAQSYSDDVGRVFAGRYFGLWNYTAPMLI